MSTRTEQQGVAVQEAKESPRPGATSRRSRRATNRPTAGSDDWTRRERRVAWSPPEEDEPK